MGVDLHNPWRMERANRLRLAASELPFGISYLDDALGAIQPIDFIVIGAGTGIGKTEIASVIAKAVVAKGKHVLFYALEAFRGEIHSRIKYQAIAEYYFANRAEFPLSMHLTYHEWARGLFDKELEGLEEKIAEELTQSLSLLEVIHPTTSEFTARDLTELTKEWSSASLVILDHIHYLHWGSEIENTGIRNAVSELRDFVNETEVPVIALSHLRKADKRDESLIPTTEELHGSSEISKRANSVVTFGPAYSFQRDEEEIKLPAGHTFVRVNKARNGSEGCTHNAGLLRFDLSRHTYAPTYIPFECNRWATELTPMIEFKRWMKHGKHYQTHSLIQPSRPRTYERGTCDD